MNTITESKPTLQPPITMEEALAWQYFNFEPITYDVLLESPNHWEMSNVSPH